MNELLGLAYYAEIPAVIMDIQRVGPSTGMPTRTQQGDVFECAYASHGDTKHILLFPSNPAECFDFAVKSFDLAERFQTPVFMLSDLDIGMNDWVVPRLTWDDSYRPDRGRVLQLEEIEKISKYFRYSPEDENYVAARTLPGVHEKGAFFTRGSGHTKLGGIHGNAGRISGSGRPAAEEAQGRGEVRSRAHHRTAQGRASSAWSPSADAIRRFARRWIFWNSAAFPPTTCACARFRSMRAWTLS